MERCHLLKYGKENSVNEKNKKEKYRFMTKTREE